MSNETQGLLFNPWHHELVDKPEAERVELSIEERFERFHKENPNVYATLVRLARDMKERGLPFWSMKAAFEVARYSAIITYNEDWKLNNNYTAHYARLIMQREADLAGFFRTRDQGTGDGGQESASDGPTDPAQLPRSASPTPSP